MAEFADGSKVSAEKLWTVNCRFLLTSLSSSLKNWTPPWLENVQPFTPTCLRGGGDVGRYSTSDRLSLW